VTAALLPELARESTEGILRVVDRHVPGSFSPEDLEELAGHILGAVQTQARAWEDLERRLAKGMTTREAEALARANLQGVGLWLELQEKWLRLADVVGGGSPATRAEVEAARTRIEALQASGEALLAQATAPPRPIDQARFDRGAAQAAEIIARSRDKAPK
jgi:hypothetical protein